ncbi:Ribosomal-protein-alanine acetyltransferase [Candidatus Erwinia haradaeae]|uniref:Ribosomal-protein-alanine acetyltransferase, partial n=1 Tax=Candidatus Erwinia haradaeae TaxID=1922217 RepID=A0A451DA80_9GAMM|nr:Ribosomal-protein-alanine acetyltransferase [Candidatus Erwinia haradaeae]
MNQIAVLGPHNCNAAFDIERRSHSYPWMKNIFFSNQGPRYLNFCLMVNGVMAAFVISQWVLDEATLLNLAVDPKFQRHGLGKVLLNYLIKELKTHGVGML